MNLKAILRKADAKLDELLAMVDQLQTINENLMDENFELEAQVKALQKIRHEERMVDVSDQISKNQWYLP